MTRLCGLCGLINERGLIDTATFPSWFDPAEIDDEMRRYIEFINKNRHPVHGGTYVASDSVLIPRRHSEFHGYMLRVVTEDARANVRLYKLKKMCDLCIIRMIKNGEVEAMSKEGDTLDVGLLFASYM